MSLFERIKNRRYNLTEQPTDSSFTARNRKDVKKILSKITNDPKGTADEVLKGSSKSVTSPKPGDAAKEKSIVRNFNKKEKKFSKTNVTSSSRVKATSDILNTSGGATSKQKDFAKQFDPKNLSKTLSKTTSDPKGETLVKGTSDEKLIRTTKPTGDEGQFRRNARRRKITGDVIPKKDLPKTKGVNQADVSKKAKEFTKKINKERIVKQKNIFGGEDTVKTKKKTSSLTSRGTRTKTPTVQGQKKLNLGKYTKGKVQPKIDLKPGGVIKTDLRTVPKKYPRGQRPKMSPAELKKVEKIASKPEKMVTVKDPVKGGFREVGATTKQGKKVLKTKQSVSTDDLIDPNPSKPQPKPKNLFGRIKGRIKDFYSNPEKSDFRTNRKSSDGSFSTTRNVYKGKTGAVKKFFDKMPRGNRRAALTIAAIAGAGMLARRALPTPKPKEKQYYTRPVKLSLNAPDKGYRSKGAKNPIKTKMLNDRATSLPPKTPPSGFYKKKIADKKTNQNLEDMFR